jgi:dTDP-4-dehydrorhamnose reductase
MGERYVVENAKKYLVCRAGWMMGGGAKKDKKFINKLFKQINNGAETLNIVNDKDGTPTYTVDFAKNVLALMQTKKWGLYNMVCGGQTSREEVCRELLRILNLEDKINIELVSSDFFAAEYFAPRPPCERLVNKRLDLIDCNKMRDWKISLKDYIDDYYSDWEG